MLFIFVFIFYHNFNMVNFNFRIKLFISIIILILLLIISWFYSKKTENFKTITPSNYFNRPKRVIENFQTANPKTYLGTMSYNSSDKDNKFSWNFTIFNSDKIYWLNESDGCRDNGDKSPTCHCIKIRGMEDKIVSYNRGRGPRSESSCKNSELPGNRDALGEFDEFDEVPRLTPITYTYQNNVADNPTGTIKILPIFEEVTEVEASLEITDKITGDINNVKKGDIVSFPNNLSDVSLVAPYKLIGEEALSVLRAITFFTLFFIQASIMF